MTVAAVVLAAGASRRLGRPKQNILLAGETLLQRTVRLARDAGLAPIVLVAREEFKQAVNAPDVIVAINHEADEGIASSIRCGIRVASGHTVGGAVIMTCDQPSLRADHLHRLIEDQHRTTASLYSGSVGVPAYFPVELFSSLLQLRGDTGARSLLKTAHAIKAEELSLDIDTEEDLNLARTLLE